MKSWKKRKALCRILICLLAAGTMLVASTVSADTDTKQKAETKQTAESGAKKVEKEVKSETREQAGKKRDTIIKEAVSALEQTKNAIEALKKKDKKAALDALAAVTGKLDIVIARDPKLANAPIDVRVETYDLIGTVDTIKKSVKIARDLLGDGEVQQAREILSGMASEIDFLVTSIPLASYSAGIKDVAKLVDEEKYEEATEALYELLSTLVITKHVIPLPILRAEEMLKKAEELAAVEKRTEEQDKKIDELLADIKVQIEMAEALGYGDKKEYKKFYKQIKEIKKKTDGGIFGKGDTDLLKNSLKKFKEKIFGKKDSDAASNSDKKESDKK